ncbi:MAG: Rrf2 family transcriptional regulator [bacterium]|nr:Rrf2 family transcriptional regulator [bacterium]
MFLSQSAKYALRATIYLAENGVGPHLSRDIAEALNVPAQYLAKILQDLARNGLLISAKGRGGGFRLALPPAQIELLSVVRAIEGERFGEGCALGLPDCSEEAPCALHNAWKALRGDLLGMLQGTHLSELPKGSSLIR